MRGIIVLIGVCVALSAGSAEAQSALEKLYERARTAPQEKYVVQTRALCLAGKDAPEEKCFSEELRRLAVELAQLEMGEVPPDWYDLDPEIPEKEGIDLPHIAQTCKEKTMLDDQFINVADAIFCVRATVKALNERQELIRKEARDGRVP